jgi:hypothetical protein
LNDARVCALAASVVALAVASLPGCAKACDSYTFARDLIQNAATPAEFLSALDRYCGPPRTPETSGTPIIRSSDGRNLCALTDREKQQALSRSKELTFTVEGAWLPPFTSPASKGGTGAQLMQRRWIGLVDDPRHPTFVKLSIYPDALYALYLVRAGSAPSKCSLLGRFATLAYDEGHVRVHLTVPRFRSSTQWQYRSDSVGWGGRLLAFLTVDRYGVDRTEIYRGPLVKHQATWEGQDANMSIAGGASWYLIRDSDRLVLMSGRI